MTGRSRARDRSRPSGGTPAWTPKRLANLAAWFRADLGVTGSSVSAWADQSGNGRHVTQGTGSAQPTFVSSVAGLGGRPALSFDGGDRLVSSAFDLSNTLSLFFVLGSVTARGMIAEHGLGTHWYAYSTGNAAVFFLSHNTTQNPVTTWAQANQQGAAIYDRSAAPVIRGNRALLTPTATSGSPPVAGNVNAALAIGARTDGSLAHNGQIAEIVIYDRALNATEIAQVEAYLFNRYGV